MPNLISAHGIDGVNKIIIFSGVSGTQTNSFSGPGTFTTGLTMDGSGNLVNSDAISNLAYIHSGVSATITSSFTITASSTGLAIYAGDLYSTNSDSGSIYKYNGISSSFVSSFSHPALPRGISGDGGTNLVSSSSANAGRMYFHSGYTSTITSSFNNAGSPSVATQGVTIDNLGNLLEHTSGGVIYQRSGLTATISTSFTTLSTGNDGRDITMDTPLGC